MVAKKTNEHAKRVRDFVIGFCVTFLTIAALYGAYNVSGVSQEPVTASRVQSLTNVPAAPQFICGHSEKLRQLMFFCTASEVGRWEVFWIVPGQILQDNPNVQIQFIEAEVYNDSYGKIFTTSPDLLFVRFWSAATGVMATKVVEVDGSMQSCNHPMCFRVDRSGDEPDNGIVLEGLRA
jgi:hypothetical protein